MKRNINKLIVLALLFPVVFSSCLKDKPVNDYTGIKPIIIIPNANWPKTTAVTPTFLPFDVTTKMTLYARISWENPLDKDITVTYAEDAGAITNYNSKMGGSWVPLNKDAYKMSSYSVLIPKGENDASIPFEIYQNKIDFIKDNMLALSITDASGQDIASNYKTYLVPVSIKNTYDGVYTLKSKMTHPTNAAYSGVVGDTVPVNIPLKSVTKVSNIFDVSHPWSKTSGAKFDPGYEPLFTIDAATNAVTITAPKSPLGATVLNNTAYTSKYDATKKIIYAAWKFPITGGDVVVFDTLTYSKAR